MLALAWGKAFLAPSTFWTLDSPSHPSIHPSSPATDVQMSTTAVLTDTRTRIVHFDNECVIIPEPERLKTRPKIVAKSYSLPLWKRRVSPSPVAPTSPGVSESGELHSPTNAHVVVKVPLPSFSLQRTPSRSPEQMFTAPTSIMVHARKPSHSPERTPRPFVRRPSLPLPPRSIPLTTVPLRQCCPECVAIAEEAVHKGEDWQVHFSRSARRKRSLSVDSVGAHPHTHSPRILHTSDMAAVFSSLTVDEVDQQRSARQSGSSSSAEGGSLLGPSISRRDTTTFSVPAVISLNDDIIRPAPSAAPVPPPILEENEDDLFPLPSPRRTPSPSPNASTTSLNSAKRPSPRPSLRSGSPLLRCSLSPLSRSDSSTVPAAARNADVTVAAIPTYSPVPRTPSPARPSIPTSVSAPAVPTASLRRGSPSLGSPQSSPRTPATTPSHPQHHHSTWSSFFRAGGQVLRGVSSMGGPGM